MRMQSTWHQSIQFRTWVLLLFSVWFRISWVQRRRILRSIILIKNVFNVFMVNLLFTFYLETFAFKCEYIDYQPFKRYISLHYCSCKVMKAGSSTLAKVFRKFGCRTLHHGLHALRGQDPYINVTRWRTATMKDRRSTNKRNTKLCHIIPRVMMLAEKNGHPLLHYFEDDVEFIILPMPYNRSAIYWIFVIVCNPSINSRWMDFHSWMTPQSTDHCMFIILSLYAALNIVLIDCELICVCTNRLAQMTHSDGIYVLWSRIQLI